MSKPSFSWLPQHCSAVALSSFNFAFLACVFGVLVAHVSCHFLPLQQALHCPTNQWHSSKREPIRIVRFGVHVLSCVLLHQLQSGGFGLIFESMVLDL